MVYIKAFINITLGLLILSLAGAVTLLFWLNSLEDKPTILFGDSMPPTLQTFDAVYHREAGTIERGDIITYFMGGGRMTHRVIGLPGETVEVKEGAVLVERDSRSFILEETYVRFPYFEWNLAPMVLKEGEYLTLGDNRHAASGRTPHLVAGENVQGIVDRISFPPWRAKSFAK